MHRTRPLAFLDTATLITLGVVLFALAAWTGATSSAPASPDGESAVAFADDLED